MATWNFVRRSFYQDSVTLMRLTRDLEGAPGVERAAAMMGTPENKALLAAAGLFVRDGEAAAPGDLIVAVAAETEAAAREAHASVDQALAAARAHGGAAATSRPRTLDGALRALPGANIALVSVPGRYAGAEAARCLAAGLHVMLFSDNVPVATEIALKRTALHRDLLMMGPDCGTALVDGVPLGFANVVPRGRIGVAAASGTGLQEVTSIVAMLGEGVSQAIGVGGRDLSDDVGGLMTDRALDLLDRDADTTVICLIGKPPGARTGQRLAGRVARLAKPCVVHFAGRSVDAKFRWTAATLEDTARAAVALARGEEPAPVEFTNIAEARRLADAAAEALAPSQRFVRGVYAGGTLAYEAVALLGSQLPGVAPGVLGEGTGHRVVDLGEDRFTIGRPHPMLDGTLRREWIEREAADPATAVLLLDVVLGYGAHPDPAGEIAPAIRGAIDTARASSRALAVVTSVTGTDADPQNRARQAATLHGAGAVVMPSNAQAARLAALIAARASR